MKRAGELIIMLCMALSLTACPGKGGDSNGAAATPAAPDTTDVTPQAISCQWDWQYRTYVDQNKNRCTPSTADVNSTSYCHNYIYNMKTGQWQDSSGKAVNCVQGYIDFYNFIPYSYINSNGQTQTNCSMYTTSYYTYGTWFPIQFGAALICVKQTYVNTWYPNYNFNNNYYYGNGMGSSYYYPTSCRYGVDCHSRCGNISGGGQFGGLWFGGTLGLCL